MNTCEARILKAASSFSYRTKVIFRYTRYSRAIYGNTHRNNTLFAVEIALRCASWKMFEKMMFASFSFPFRDKKKLRVLFFKNVSMEA